MKNERMITWKVRGSDVTHTIPDGATVSFSVPGATLYKKVSIRYLKDGTIKFDHFKR